MKISLTFDNGPDPSITPAILSILAERDLKATFFVLGRKISDRAGQDLLARLRAEGHAVGNHSFSHSTPIGDLSATEALSEIQKTEDLLGTPQGGPALFRPFGRKGHIGPHLLNASARDYLVSNRYTCVLWNCLAREWDYPTDWAVPTLQDCARRDWSVVVMHDILPEAPGQTIALLDGLLSSGATFSTDFPDDCLPIRHGVADEAMLQPLVRSSDPLDPGKDL